MLVLSMFTVSLGIFIMSFLQPKLGTLLSWLRDKKPTQTIESTCATGTEITGVTSCIVNSRNFAAAEGVSTAKQANVLVDGEN